MAYDKLKSKIFNFLLSNFDLFSRNIFFTLDGSRSIFSVLGIIFSLAFYTVVVLVSFILIKDFIIGTNYDFKIKTHIEEKNIFPFETPKRFSNDFIAIKVGSLNESNKISNFSQYECIYHNVKNFNYQKFNFNSSSYGKNQNLNKFISENGFTCYFELDDLIDNNDFLQIDLIHKSPYFNAQNIYVIDLIYPKITFDYDDFYSPMKLFYIKETEYYTSKSIPAKSLMIINSTSIVDKGLIFESTTSGSYLSINESYQTYFNSSPHNDKIIYSIKLSFDMKKKIYSFIPVKFPDRFAKIYCMVQLILFVCRLVLYLPTNLNYSVKLNNLITKIYYQSIEEEMGTDKIQNKEDNSLPVHKIVLKRTMDLIFGNVKQNTNINSLILEEQEKLGMNNYDEIKIPKKIKFSDTSLNKFKLNSNKSKNKKEVLLINDNYQKPNNIDILSMKVYNNTEGPTATDSNVVPLNANTNNLNLQPKTKISMELLEIIKSQKENRSREEKKDKKLNKYLKFSCCGIFINKIFKENSPKEKILYKSFRLIDEYIKQKLEVKSYLDLFNEIRLIKNVIFKPQLINAMNYLEHPSYLYIDQNNENKIEDFFKKYSTNKDINNQTRDADADTEMICDYFCKKVLMGRMLPEDNVILFNLDKPQIETIIDKLQFMNEQLIKGKIPEFNINTD